MDIGEWSWHKFSLRLIVISIKRDLYFVKIRRVPFTKGDNEKECRDEIIACRGSNCDALLEERNWEVGPAVAKVVESPFVRCLKEDACRVR